MSGSEAVRGEWNQDDLTRGVSLLIGDPKKALLKLSGPMVVAMMILAAYNLVSAIWVAGLGSDALAAVGFVSPIFMVVVGLSNGLGAGVSSSISRRIGAQDKRGADNTAMHAMLLTVIVSVILTLVLLYSLEPMLAAMGAGESIDLAVEYGNIVFAGSILVVFTNTALCDPERRGRYKTHHVCHGCGIADQCHPRPHPDLLGGPRNRRSGMGDHHLSDASNFRDSAAACTTDHNPEG